MSKGKTSIKKSDAIFFELQEYGIFEKNRKNAHELSNFEQSMIILVGNSIRPIESQHFWSDGCYSWFRDGSQEKVDRLWLTKNGILVFEQASEGGGYKLFRIDFNF